MKKILKKIVHCRPNHHDQEQRLQNKTNVLPKYSLTDIGTRVRFVKEPETTGVLQENNFQDQWNPSCLEINKLCQLLSMGESLLQLKQTILLYKRGRKVTRSTFNEGLNLVLLEACRSGRADALSYMLKKYQPFISVSAVVDYTKQELAHTCELSSSKEFSGTHCTYSLLHVATGALVTECLIKNGAQIDVTNCCGDTPLHFAIKKFVSEYHGRLRMKSFDKTTLNSIKCLITAGADVNAKNARGETPLMFAVEDSYFFKPLFKLLTSSAIPLELNSIQRCGFSALHISLTGDVVQFLLENGASPQFVPPTSSDDYVPCPMYLAAANSNIGKLKQYLMHPKCTLTFRVDVSLISGAAKRLSLTSNCRPITGEYSNVTADWREALKLADQCNVHKMTRLLIERLKKEAVNDEHWTIEGLAISLEIMEAFIGKTQPYLVSCYHKAHWLCNRCTLAQNYLLKAANLLLVQLQHHCQHPLTTTPTITKELLQQILLSYLSLSDYNSKKKVPGIQSINSFLSVGMKILVEYAKLVRGHYHCDWKLDDNCARCYLWCFNKWLAVEPLSEKCHCLGQKLVVDYSFLFRNSLLLIALQQYHPFQFTSMNLINNFLQWGIAESLNWSLSTEANDMSINVIHFVMCKQSSKLPGSKPKIIENLIYYGAHLDIVNKNGDDCFSLNDETDSDVNTYLMSKLPLPLTCLTSRAIVAHGIKYTQAPLPYHVKQFISYHDKSLV